MGLPHRGSPDLIHAMEAAMIEPTESSFSRRLDGPPLLRIGVVIGALLVLLASAALTMGASPGSATGVPPAMFPFPDGRGDGFQMGAGGFDGRGHGMGGRGFGEITITAISGSNLSLKTADGWTRTIAVTSSTTIAKGGRTVAVGDLAVGDRIVFLQTRNSDGSFSITSIQVVLPRVGGEVTARSGSTITVKQPDGTSATIHVGNGTTYQVPGIATPSVSDISVGMRVVAEGTLGSDGSLTATSVWGHAAGQPGQPGWGPGRMRHWGQPGAPANPVPSASPSSDTSGG